MDDNSGLLSVNSGLLWSTYGGLNKVRSSLFRCLERVVTR